jgi:magnesium and cobalt transporter
MSLPNGGWLADAKINLDDLGKELNITFEAEDSVTLGGFMTEMLQHLPKKGERLSYNGYVFQVQQATIKQVIQVLIFQEAMPLNDHNLITMS